MSKTESTSGQDDLTVFMMVKTMPEWLGLPVEQRFEHFNRYMTPILKKYQTELNCRIFDTEFTFPSGHVTAVSATALALWLAFYPLLGRRARIIALVVGVRMHEHRFEIIS